MMTENKPGMSVPAVHAVDGFEPAAFTRQIPNEDGTMSLYLDVKFRLLWFRLRYPNGKLDPEIVDMNDRYAVVSCKVYTDKTDAADQFIAKSIAQRFAVREKFGDRYLELAETAAVGRALAAAGFGTQFCTSADGTDAAADAPVDAGTPVRGEERQNPVQKQEETPAMTLEEAKNVLVKFGKYKGFTLGQIAT